MRLISTILCKEGDLGFHGNMFGGKLMYIIDEVAAAMACRVANSPRMVTVLVEKLEFRKPVKSGQLIEIWGTVKKMGRSSVTLNIECRKHNLRTDKQEIVVNTDFKFVKVDEYGDSVPISSRIREKYP